MIYDIFSFHNADSIASFGAGGLQLAVFRAVEAGAVFLHVWQVAVAYYTGLRVLRLQSFQQGQQRRLLLLCARVAGLTTSVKSPFIAHTQRVLVVAPRMGPYQLFVARLVGVSVAGDVVVIAGETEPVGMAAYQCRHRKRTVTACGTAMNHYQVNLPHSRYG